MDRKLIFVLLVGIGIGFGVSTILYPDPLPPVSAASGNGDVNGDERINIADAVYILGFLFSSGPDPVPIECTGGGSGSLPATGQTTCYDVGGNEIACDSADAPGQDGFHQAGCAMADRFEDDEDGTVTDNCTGLMWQKDTAPGAYSNPQALQYCDTLVLADYDDWRLPNVRELQSIVDYGRSSPAIDPLFTADSIWYWSSTSVVGTTGHAWLVNFGNPLINDGDKAGNNLVRAVRDL